MPKATIEYDLNDSDDIMAHLRATKSTDLALVLWEFAYNTKKKLIYDVEKELSEENSDFSHYDVIDKVYEKFWDVMRERGIELDDLIN